MTTPPIVTTTQQKLPEAVLGKSTLRRSAPDTTQEKTTPSPRTAAGLSLPEDIVTLSSTDSSVTAKKKSQPVTSDEKRALQDPNVSFSVYG